MTTSKEHTEPTLRFPGFTGDWNNLTVSDFCDVISGHPVPGADILDSPTGVKLLRGINITKGRIRHSSDIDRFFGGSIDGLERFLVETGDIVLGMDGSKVGRNVAVVGDEDAGSFLIQRVARLRGKKENSLGFAYQIIFSEYFHRYVDRINTSSGIPHISLKQIRDFDIPAPTMDEQRKIAEFLGLIDEKIRQTRRRKLLLEQYRRSCLKKIFSQEIRFKDKDGNDFPDWEPTTIGQVGSFYYGKSAPKFSLSPDAPTPCVRYGELYTKFGVIIDEVVSKTNIDPKNLRFSKGGEILVPRVGEDPLDFAACCCYLPLEGIAIGEMISVFNTQENPIFYTYYFRTLRKEFARVVEGGNVSNLYYSYLEPIEIGKPHPDEQAKIAEFLMEIDKKVSLVSQELELARTFKKGLLQQMFV